MDYRNTTVHAICIHTSYNTFQLHMLTLYASMDEILKKHIKLIKIHLKIVVWAFHKLYITTTAKTIG